VVSAGLRQGNVKRDLEQASLTVKPKHAFGKNVKISFQNPNPSLEYAYPFIAIFWDESGDLPLDVIPDWTLFMAWLNDCNSQNECESTTAEGTVTFSAADPKSYYYYEYNGFGYGYFPFRNGSYVVCYLNEIYESDDDGAAAATELITDCKRFQVKKPKNKIKKKAKVNPLSTEIGVGEAFQAKFKAPIPIQNQWIGLFPAESNGPPKGKLDGKSILWGYTGCPTQEGDQEETKNCVKKKKKGMVKLNKKNLADDCEFAEWPVQPGIYYMCISFHSNEPYNLFKCSKAITVS